MSQSHKLEIGKSKVEHENWTKNEKFDSWKVITPSITVREMWLWILVSSHTKRQRDMILLRMS